jgi:hypothetical protein
MSVNPYSAAALPTQFGPSSMVQQAVVPVTPKPNPKPASNRIPVTIALIGLAIGFATATYPTPGQTLPAFERGQAIGQVFGHAMFAMILGWIAGLLLRMLFTRPIRAVIVLTVLGGVAGFYMTAEAGRLIRTNRWASVDLARHQGPGRAQADNLAFSFVLPANWKRMPNIESNLHYGGPMVNGFEPTVMLRAEEFRGRFSDDLVASAAGRMLPPGFKLQAVTNLTVDGKKAYVVQSRTLESQKKMWLSIYVFPGKYKMYLMAACGRDPKPAHVTRTVQDLVNSVRID